ncbi:MAG: GDSL-type esterase/lipase family protein [Streptococcus sp.]
MLSPSRVVFDRTVSSEPGIRGYKTDLLREHLDAHVFGQAVDKIFLLIGTNDIGKEMPLSETIDNMSIILQEMVRLLPLAQIKLVSVLPVNEGETYKGTVYIRTNQKIQALNQAYRELAQGMINVEFINVFDYLLERMVSSNQLIQQMVFI